MNKEIKEKLEVFFKELELPFNMVSCINIDNICKFTDFDSLTEELEQSDGGFNIEFVYYADALNYLFEDSGNLDASLEIACDMGLNTGQLNSTLLASLLASEEARDAWENCRGEIEDFLDSLESDFENDEE